MAMQVFRPLGNDFVTLVQETTIVAQSLHLLAENL